MILLRSFIKTRTISYTYFLYVSLSPESASYVGDLERAKDPIAVVRPRVRHLTLHEVVNDSPKRPNQLLLPFSYNKEISKVDPSCENIHDINVEMVQK